MLLVLSPHAVDLIALFGYSRSENRTLIALVGKSACIVNKWKLKVSVRIELMKNHVAHLLKCRNCKWNARKDLELFILKLHKKILGGLVKSLSKTHSLRLILNLNAQNHNFSIFLSRNPFTAVINLYKICVINLLTCYIDKLLLKYSGRKHVIFVTIVTS